MKTIVIDNSKIYRDALRPVLQKFPGEITIVAEAGSAAEGLVLIEKTKPDLLLLDIEMGEISGVQMLLECKTFDFDVLFLSGLDERDYQIRALKMAGFSFCSKHASPNELMTAVNRIAKQNNRKFTGQRITVLRTHLSKDAFKENCTIALPTLVGFCFVPVMDIIRFRLEKESVHPLTIFSLSGGEECQVPVHFSFYEKLLSRHSFINTDSFQMINTNRIKAVITKYELHMEDNTVVPAKSWKPVTAFPAPEKTGIFSRIIKAIRKRH